MRLNGFSLFINITIIMHLIRCGQNTVFEAASNFYRIIRCVGPNLILLSYLIWTSVFDCFKHRIYTDFNCWIQFDTVEIRCLKQALVIHLAAGFRKDIMICMATIFWRWWPRWRACCCHDCCRDNNSFSFDFRYCCGKCYRSVTVNLGRGGGEWNWPLLNFCGFKFLLLDRLSKALKQLFLLWEHICWH